MLPEQAVGTENHQPSALLEQLLEPLPLPLSALNAKWRQQVVNRAVGVLRKVCCHPSDISDVEFLKVNEGPRLNGIAVHSVQTEGLRVILAVKERSFAGKPFFPYLVFQKNSGSYIPFHLTTALGIGSCLGRYAHAEGLMRHISLRNIMLTIEHWENKLMMA